MHFYHIASSEDALAYLLDCTLATVETMAEKKRIPKYEYERHVGIAQRNLELCRKFDCNIAGTRGQKVMEEFNGDVSEYGLSIQIQTNT